MPRPFLPLAVPGWLAAGATLLALALGGCRPAAGGTGPAGPVFSADSSQVTVAANAAYAGRGWWWQQLWGRHYRALWATPVAAPVLRLGAAGLQPVRVGGSFQTNVLQLRTPDGRQFVLRSVDKDLSRALGSAQGRSWLEQLVVPVLRDQTCAAPPYGAYVAAELARAAGVYHTNPRLVYLLPDATLGLLARRFQPALYLLEERPEGDQAHAASFGGARQVLGSRAALGAVLGRGRARFDARAYLRARLLDMLLGDWSRRADQWRWAAFATGPDTTFRPIPRDRDQAFFRFNDGWLTQGVAWLRPRYQTFAPQLRAADVKALTVTARALDHTALAWLPAAAFQAEADSLARRLPEAALVRALQAVPAAARPGMARQLLPALRARRAALPAVAARYYQLLQAEPTIVGTNAAERFELLAAGPGRLRLRVWARRPLRPDSLLGETHYDVRRTTRLTVYGLGGNDIFELRGRLAPGFGVHLHGGAGRNQFLQETLLQANGPGLTVYATPADLVQLSSSVRQLPEAPDSAALPWLARYYRLGAGERK